MKTNESATTSFSPKVKKKIYKRQRNKRWVRDRKEVELDWGNEKKKRELCFSEHIFPAATHTSLSHSAVDEEKKLSKT